MGDNPGANKPPQGYIEITVDDHKITYVVNWLVQNTQGPREAIALLIAALIETEKLAAQQMRRAPLTREQLIEEVTTGLHSARFESEGRH